MVDYEKIVLDLIKPLVEDEKSLQVKLMSSLDEREVLLYVYANSDDVARLIGRGGVNASALRQMISVASKKDDKRITIKFESY